MLLVKIGNGSYVVESFLYLVWLFSLVDRLTFFRVFKAQLDGIWSFIP